MFLTQKVYKLWHAVMLWEIIMLSMKKRLCHEVNALKARGTVIILFVFMMNIQSTLVISKSKGLYETLRDIRPSTYQIWWTEENN